MFERKILLVLLLETFFFYFERYNQIFFHKTRIRDPVFGELTLTKSAGSFVWKLNSVFDGAYKFEE